MKLEQQDLLPLSLETSESTDQPGTTDNVEQREEQEWMKRLVSAIVLFWASDYVSHRYGIEQLEGKYLDHHWEFLKPSHFTIWVDCGFFFAVCVYAGYLVLQSNPRSVLLCETSTLQCGTMVMGLLLIMLCAPQICILLGWMLFGQPPMAGIGMTMTEFGEDLYMFGSLLGKILSIILLPLSYCCN